MFANILFDILAPILLMIGLGALLRWRFRLDLATLSKLNIYLFVPAFVFARVSQSTLSWSDMGAVIVITMLQTAVLGLVVWGFGALLRINTKTLAAIAMGVMFYNSANYGIPLAELAFPGTNAGAVQSFVVLTQNLLTFTIGLGIAAWAGSGSAMQGVWTLIKLPVLPTLTAALLAKWWLGLDPDNALPVFVIKPAEYIAGGLVAVALITLGAQLASNPRWPRWKPITAVLVLRLVYAPAQMIAMLAFFHWMEWPKMDVWPWPAGLLILTAAVPTAVNTLLLTLELGGDAELSADCVFWTTVSSAVSITGWLFVLEWVV